MINFKLLSDKRVRLYELADMEDMDNLIDIKFTELSKDINSLNKKMNELQALIFQRRSEEFDFLMNRKKPKNKKR